MEKKYELTMPAADICIRWDDPCALERIARFVAEDFSGILGWDITDITTGKIVSFREDGMDYTIADLCESEMISARLYYVLMKVLIKTGLDVETARATVNLYNIRDLLLDGAFVEVQVGYKTRTELYTLLMATCGNTRITRAAINEDILLYALWEMEHNRSFTRYADKLLPYVADLSDESYETFYW